MCFVSKTQFNQYAQQMRVQLENAVPEIPGMVFSLNIKPALIIVFVRTHTPLSHVTALLSSLLIYHPVTMPCPGNC